MTHKWKRHWLTFLAYPCLCHHHTGKWSSSRHGAVEHHLQLCTPCWQWKHFPCSKEWAPLHDTACLPVWQGHCHCLNPQQKHIHTYTYLITEHPCRMTDMECHLKLCDIKLSIKQLVHKNMNNDRQKRWMKAYAEMGLEPHNFKLKQGK